jgi:hypothetical protein
MVLSLFGEHGNERVVPFGIQGGHPVGQLFDFRAAAMGRTELFREFIREILLLHIREISRGIVHMLFLNPKVRAQGLLVPPQPFLMFCIQYTLPKVIPACNSISFCGKPDTFLDEKDTIRNTLQQSAEKSLFDGADRLR